MRAASYELARRRATFAHLRGGDLDDLAHQSADDALLLILGKLDDFRAGRLPAPLSAAGRAGAG